MLINAQVMPAARNCIATKCSSAVSQPVVKVEVCASDLSILHSVQACWLQLWWLVSGHWIVYWQVSNERCSEYLKAVCPATTSSLQQKHSGPQSDMEGQVCRTGVSLRVSPALHYSANIYFHPVSLLAQALLSIADSWQEVEHFACSPLGEDSF